MSLSFYNRYWEDKNTYLDDFFLKWPKLQNYIPKEKGITILDFGCGNGFVLKEISFLNPAARLIGVDISEIALTQARKILPGAEFSLEEDGKILLPDESVDFAICSEVMEHIYDTETAFREMARVLKKGGEFLLTVPYHGLIKNLLIAIFAFDRHFDPAGPHIRFFSKKSLFRILVNNNFDIAKCGYYGRFWPIPHSIYVLAKKK